MFRLLTALTIFCLTTAAALADYNRARSDFMARPFEERAMLQWELTWTGLYNGLTDGDFGPRTYRAVTDFQSQTGFPPNGVLSAAQKETLEAVVEKMMETVGFEFLQDDRANLTVGVPLQLTPIREDTRRGTRWRSSDEEIVLETIAMPAAEVPYAMLYSRLSRETPRRNVSYNVIRDRFFIVTGTHAGKTFYTRMFRASGATRGVTISWEPTLSPELDGIVLAIAGIVFEPSDVPPLTEPEAPPDGEPLPTTSGTGFFITTGGVMLTNAHVVSECEQIEVPHYGVARLLRKDQVNDLALIQVSHSEPTMAAVFQESPMRLGMDVVVFGYPLADFLGSALNVTSGHVSSLSGIGGDTRFFQLTAPVQKGNSGGPVLDMTGRVTGVATLAVPGALAQNVNFAIRKEAMIAFLQSAGIDYVSETSDATKNRPDVAEDGAAFTAQVICSQ